MKRQYVLVMFLLCFFIWVVVVDNVVLPRQNQLRQVAGEYSRYRVKHWSKGGKLDLLNDQILVYVVVNHHERLYYMDYKSHYESFLKSLPKETPLEIRYENGFPKIWKNCIYEMRSRGVPVVSYSPDILRQKQRKIWKFTKIMGGGFLVLAALGLINRPRKK